MKTMQQIDKRINEKLDILKGATNDNLRVNDILRVDALSHIQALIWIMDTTEYAALPEQTKQRIKGYMK